MIDYDEYLAHIEQYQHTRNEVQNKFFDSQLEAAFMEFDEVLRRYISKLRPLFTASPLGERVLYLSEEKEEKIIFHRSLSEEHYKAFHLAFDEVVEHSILLLRQSKILANIIRDIAPDFFVD